MTTSAESFVLGLLLCRFRGMDPGVVRASMAEAEAAGLPMEVVLVRRDPRVTPDLEQLRRAAQRLISSRSLHVCPNCCGQRVGQAHPPCRWCGSVLKPGVVRLPVRLDFDRSLETGLLRDLFVRESRREIRRNVLVSPEKFGGRVPLAHELGPYRWIERIGSGAAGCLVYRAVDLRTGAEVAAKALALDSGASSAGVLEKLARICREAVVGERIRSPHLLEIGPLDRIGRWVVLPMTLVPGHSLEWYLQLDASLSGGLASLSFLVQCLRKAARGLHGLHAAGYLHGEVDPRNILVTTSGSAYLVDYGRAVPIGGMLSPPAPDPAPYRAPEATRAGAWSDPRSEVYSLGAILQRILSRGGSDRGVAPCRFEAIGSEENHPLRALSDLCARAIDADPGKRPRSAGEFAEAIRDWREMRRSPRSPSGLAPAAP